MPKDYYKILGVSKDASAEDIKKAYRKLAHQYHPDKSGGSEAKFKEINEAFQVIGNEEKRKKYDQFGADFEAQGGFGGGVSWDDFMRAARGKGNSQDFQFNVGGIDLSDIFGDIFGFGGARGSSRTRRGADIQVDIELTLRDVLHDITKEFNLRKKNKCDVCQGSGAEPGSGTRTCSTCNGKGQIEEVQRSFLGMIRTARTCDACGGEGSVAEKKCKHCQGAGVMRTDSEIKFKIPAGISDGETLRVRGQGEAAQGGEQGDLYVRVHVRGEEGVERDGVDLYMDIPVNFAQAALGDKVEIKTLEGSLTLAIPAGTQPGQLIRLKGHGFPHLHKSALRGDLYVRVHLAVPKSLSRKQKKLLEELKELGE